MPIGAAGFAAIGGAALAAGGSIGGGILSSNASSSAAKAQNQQLQNSLQYQQGIYNNATNNLNPYITAGSSALPYLLGAYGLPGGNPGGTNAAFQNFIQTPNYSFPLQQGNLALNRQLASAGLTGSGAAVKDAIGYNQGYASQFFNNYLQGLSNVAGNGQQASAALGGLGNTAATTNLQGSGLLAGSTGAGIIGSANAINSGISGAIGSLNASPNSTSNLGSLASVLGLGASSYGQNQAATGGVLQAEQSAAGASF